jgi:succinoglycan biosynthesis transport protein ExoP
MAFRRDSTTLSSADAGDDDGHGRKRRRVFLWASLPLLLAGLAYSAFQRPVYESTATVLMSAPTAVDEQMLEADVQGVAIQRRTLTGADITRALSDRLAESYGAQLTPLELRALLRVAAVPDTNLLELAAQGTDAELLPVLLETWIKIYSDERARDIAARKARTVSEVESELEGLDERLEEAREALAAYREEHDILSPERQQNEVMARLDGLNESLNTAIEEEVRARSNLSSLRSSLESGGRLVPDAERGEVTAMAQELATLRTRLAELRARYTDDYIAKDPRLRQIPEQVAELEAELAEAYDEGAQAELRNAERAYASARSSVADLRQRLADHKAAVATFNTVYARHEALEEDLARLEELNREAQARLVQIEVRDVERYPQLSVIDWPAPQAARIGPPYLLLLGGTLGASLLVGIFAVWLYGYLNPRSTQPAYVTLSGVHLYPPDSAGAIGQGPGRATIESAPAQRLTQDERSEGARGTESGRDSPGAASDAADDDGQDGHAPDDQAAEGGDVTPPTNSR